MSFLFRILLGILSGGLVASAIARTDSEWGCESVRSSTNCACLSLMEEEFLEEDQLFETTFAYRWVKAPQEREGKWYSMQSPRTSLKDREGPGGPLWATPGLVVNSEHLAVMKRYFEILREDGDVPAPLIDGFEKIEAALPAQRLGLYTVSNPRGEVIGMVRTFDGSVRMRTYSRIDSRENSGHFVEAQDGWKFPYERSIESRGGESLLAKEHRRKALTHPSTRLVEIGRAYRQRNTLAGLEAKALWEMVFLEGGDWDTTYFIHTGRVGARHFSSAYGAQIAEVVLPTAPGRVMVRAQNQILSSDPKDAEYILVVSRREMAKKIILSFQQDKTKDRMIDRMPSLRKRYLRMLTNWAMHQDHAP